MSRTRPTPPSSEQQRRPHAADRLVVQRDDRGADRAVGVGVAGGQLLRDAGDLGVRLRGRHARLEASDDRQEAHAADQVRAAGRARRVGVDELHRQPGVDLGRSAEAARAEHRLVGEHEVGRHDADDRPRLARDVQRRARATLGSAPSRARQNAVADDAPRSARRLRVNVRPSTGARPSISNMPGVTPLDEDLLARPTDSSARRRRGSCRSPAAPRRRPPSCSRGSRAARRRRGRGARSRWCSTPSPAVRDRA